YRNYSIEGTRGSGGHTTEILRLVGSLSGAYSPRHYVIAESDEMSANKIHSFERSRAERESATECTQYNLHRIPRSREVRQSWLSSVFTTLHSMWFSFPLVHRIKPDLDVNSQLFLLPNLPPAAMLPCHDALCPSEPRQVLSSILSPGITVAPMAAQAFQIGVAPVAARPLDTPGICSAPGGSRSHEHQPRPGCCWAIDPDMTHSSCLGLEDTMAPCQATQIDMAWLS
ncbi:hypothetical protein STEG23_023870, partial [Scotinomys teguina]